MASYYSVGERERAAWSYLNAWPEVDRVRNLVSFDPDKIDVFLDGELLHPEPAQTAVRRRYRARATIRRDPLCRGLSD